jgi:hypothetical protein
MPRAALMLVLAAAAAPAPQLPAGFPKADEVLRYSVNWPSGLSLGEGRLEARRSGERWNFDLALDAALPGFAVTDRYHSQASAELCSLEFDKSSVHGARKASEKTVFDYRRGRARRATAGGGRAEIPIAGCARDALDFLFFVRRELGEGRIPPPQTVMVGAAYQVRLEYTGVQTVPVNEKKMRADRIVVFAKGPASDLNFEVFFSLDAARVPVVVRVPFSRGIFSMELAS